MDVQTIEQLIQRFYAGEVQLQDQLQQLQKSPEGWQLADALFASTDKNARFFAALTFIVKLNEPLDESTASAVLERLKYWLVKLQDDVPIVTRKLASAFVRYFIITKWRKPHQELRQLLGYNKFLLIFSQTLAEVRTGIDSRIEEEIADIIDLVTHFKDLKCFAAWINYGQVYWTSKPAMHSLRSLVPGFLEQLIYEGNETALEVFTDLLESFTSFFLPQHFDRMAEIIRDEIAPTITEFEYLETEATLFVVAFGNAVVQDIVEQPNSVKAQAVLQPLGLLLQSGDDLINDTIEFWNTYVEYVSDTSSGQEEWLPNAKNVMSEAARWLYYKMLIPEDADDDFKDFRIDAADLLSSMYITLGTSLLQQLIDLTTPLQDWRAVETGIFCINALADNVLEYDGDLLLPLFNPLFTTDFNTPTRRTIINMIGKYSPLLEKHPQYIPDAVRYLFASLTTIPAAAKSIYDLCSTCRTKLTADLHVFLQYTSSDPYVKEKVSGGIAAIIQALPNEQKVQPLLQLISSIEGQGLTTLECLASIGKASQEPEDIDAPEDTFWSGPGKIVQDKIISCIVLDGTGESIDTACQVLRSGYTETSGPFVFPPAVTVSFLQQCSIETPQVESVLSATSLLIVQHSRSRATRIDNEASAILQHIIGFLQALQHPSRDPSISHNCLEIISRLLRTYSAVVFAYDITFITNFALQAIEAPDILPKRSALALCTGLIKLKAIDGQALVATIVKQIAQGQRSDLDAFNEPLREIYTTYPAEAKLWTENALLDPQFPEVKVGDVEKRRFSAQLASVRGGPKMREIIRDFFAACRGVVTSYNMQ